MKFNLIKGDNKSFSIAAASIIAKVLRDEIMNNFDCSLIYDWHKNKGYGTKSHIEKIFQNGISQYHRKSFCKFIF